AELGKFSVANCDARAALELPRLELLPLAATAVVKRIAALLVAIGAFAGLATAQDAAPFPPPKTAPPVVTPGATNADPPSDAIVLFNGKDLSRWRSASGGPANCGARDGY